jgi:hypothetical protein
MCLSRAFGLVLQPLQFCRELRVGLGADSRDLGFECRRGGAFGVDACLLDVGSTLRLGVAQFLGQTLFRLRTYSRELGRQCVIGVGANLRDLDRQLIASGRVGRGTRFVDFGAATAVSCRRQLRELGGALRSGLLANTMELQRQRMLGVGACACELLLEVGLTIGTDARDLGFELTSRRILRGDARFAIRGIAKCFCFSECRFLHATCIVGIATGACELGFESFVRFSSNARHFLFERPSRGIRSRTRLFCGCRVRLLRVAQAIVLDAPRFVRAFVHQSQLVRQTDVGFGADAGDFGFERRRGLTFGRNSGFCDGRRSIGLGFSQFRSQTLFGFEADAFELTRQCAVGLVAHRCELRRQRLSRRGFSGVACRRNLLLAASLRFGLDTRQVLLVLCGRFLSGALQFRSEALVGPRLCEGELREVDFGIDRLVIPPYRPFGRCRR